MLKINKNKSFTLIEVVVAVAIFAMAAALTIAISANVINTRYKTENITNVQKNAQNIVQVLTNGVYQGNTCDWYYDPGPVAPIYFYGFVADSRSGSYIPPSPDYPSGRFQSNTLIGIYTNQFEHRIRKTFLRDGSNNLVMQVSDLDTGQSYSRNINDQTVNIESISFTTSGFFGYSENQCTDLGFSPPSQNFLDFSFRISSRTPDPKGQYVLNIHKYISAKNFKYKTR